MPLSRRREKRTHFFFRRRRPGVVSTMPRAVAGGGTLAASSAAALPLVPSFQVNELISLDKYLRSAGLLLRQVNEKKREERRKRERSMRTMDDGEETERNSTSAFLSFSPASHHLPLKPTNPRAGRRLPPRRGR